jgi:hypothetical protein
MVLSRSYNSPFGTPPSKGTKEQTPVKQEIIPPKYDFMF